MKRLLLLLTIHGCLLVSAQEAGRQTGQKSVDQTGQKPGGPTAHQPGGPTVQAPGPGVTFHSSDTAVSNAFAWAKAMALHYKGHPGDPVGPWYESALPPRFAFCMRDVSHQCIGAEILGLHRENRNMFSKFTANISASKDWCSYWEMDKFNRPSPSDYRNDREFWYNLNANFDLLDACWRSYLWTGDSLYIKDPAFLNFYARSTHEYITKWTLQPDSLLIRPAHPNAPIPFNSEDAFHRCRGLPSYSEGVPNLKMGVDLIAAIYRGLNSYAAMTDAKGDPATAARYRQKAERYRQRIDADWWDEAASLYHTYYSNDHQFGKTEGETFLLWFDALKDSTRQRRTIEHLLSMDLNVENLSYLPLQYYRRGYWEKARALVLHLANPSTQRREYPEVSYGLVEAVVQGLMGVDADARTRTVSTVYRGDQQAAPAAISASASPGTASSPAASASPGTASSPAISASASPGTASSPAAATSASLATAPSPVTAQLTNLPILNTTLTLIHSGPTRSVIRNTGRLPFQWKACFVGEYGQATVNGRVTEKLRNEKDPQGQVLSWVEVTAAPGKEISVTVSKGD